VDRSKLKNDLAVFALEVEAARIRKHLKESHRESSLSWEQLKAELNAA